MKTPSWCNPFKKKVRTVIHTFDDDYDQILYYSNPRVTYIDEPTGVPAWEDNALRMSLTGCMVADYNTSLNQFMTGDIENPSFRNNIVILDKNGKVVFDDIKFSLEAKNLEFQLSLSNIPAGVYFMTLNNGKVKKIVKQ